MRLFEVSPLFSRADVKQPGEWFAGLSDLALHPVRCEPIRGSFIVSFAPRLPKRPPAQVVEKKEPSVVRFLALAREMKALMEVEGINQAEIARRYVLTRARVCQLMAYLRLPATVLAEVDALTGQKLGERFITEKRLRKGELVPGRA